MSHVKEGYKQTKVGVIPEDWDVYKLNKYLKESRVSGSTGKDARKLTVKLWNKGVYEKNEIREGSQNTKYYKRTSGQLIYSKLDFLNCAFGIIPDNLDGFESTLDLPSFDIQNINSYFLLSSITQKRFYKRYGELANGGRKARRINPNDFLNFELATPPLPEQQKIANILSTWDSAISKQEELITQKEKLKKGLMQKLLSGEVRFGGFEKIKGYKKTKVGVIPEDWDVVKFQELIYDFRGGAPLKPSDFKKSGCKVLPKGGVVRGGTLIIKEKDQQYCSNDYANRYKNNIVNKEFTIIVLRDLVPSGPNIGLMVEINNDDKYLLAQGVYGFKVNKELALRKFYIQYSNSSFYRKHMNRLMVGSTQVHITNTELLKQLFIRPPLKEQQKIAKVLTLADKEIELLKTELEQLKIQKKGLMQQLLTGKVRVRA